MTREELIHCLESISGTKQLVVENGLMRPLDKIASMSLLQEHNCHRVLRLDMSRAVQWEESIEHRVFLLRPTLALAKKVCELIKSQPNHHYSCILVDCRRSLFDTEVEKQGLFGLVHFHQFNLSLIPLESDLFSLELPLSSSKLCTYEALSMAKTLWQLQSLYGIIPTTYCIGPLAKEVDIHFRNISADQGEPAATADQPISHIFLFDRQMDVVSTLMSALTYESMLNDYFQYSCGKISFGEAVETKLKQKAMWSAGAKAKTLQTSFDRASGLNKMEDMKSFVSNELKGLKDQHKQLEIHISACETILEESTAKSANERFALEQALVQGKFDAAEASKFIENCIRRRLNQWNVLQLACLWSGMFLRTYGYDQLPLFCHLKLRGLLVERQNTPSSALTALREGRRRQSLAAANPALPKKKTMDIWRTNRKANLGYVFSDAYVPLVCRIVEQTVSEGQDLKLKKILGEQNVFCTNPTAAKPDNRIRKAILVCCVGGVTYAEVACLRAFAQNNDFRIIIVTTSIIHRESYLQNLAMVD
uniref:Vacuolar protein sorting-associated protein 33B n=1 Tax=Ditylenchus dipsaci TaxID=166011 RepID=A0A915CTY4_9BILA